MQDASAHSPRYSAGGIPEFPTRVLHLGQKSRRVTLGNARRNGRPHDLPLAHELAIRESENPISEDREARVASTVLLETVAIPVVSPPVELDHQASADDEVDSTNGRYAHLQASSNAEHPKSKSHDGLKERLRRAIDQGEQSP